MAYFSVKKLSVNAVTLIAFCFVGLALWGEQRSLVKTQSEFAQVRYAGDEARLPAPLPKLSYASLLPLCPRDVRAQWLVGWPPTLRKAVAACTANPDPSDADALVLLAQDVKRRLVAQAEASQAVLKQWQEAQRRTKNPEVSLRLAHRIDSLAGLLTNQHERLERIAASMRAEPKSIKSLAELALLANGFELKEDFGTTPPSARVVSNPESLANWLLRHRTANDYRQVVKDVNSVGFVMPALFWTGLATLLVFVFLRLNPVPVAAAYGLFGVGALALSDVSLSGPWSMRYLVFRQFFLWPGTSSGGALVELDSLASLGHRFPPLALWLPGLIPLVVFIVALYLFVRTKWPSKFLGWMVAVTARHGGWFAGVLTVLVVGTYITLGMGGSAAAISEVMIGFFCLVIALYMARQAEFANLVQGVNIWRGPIKVAVLVATAIAVICWRRGDLGHLLVVVGVGVAFLLMFASSRATKLLFGLGALVGVALLCFVAEIQPIGRWVSHAVAWLPEHTHDRFTAMIDPYAIASSDLARVKWMVASGGVLGWGVANAPWRGLNPIAEGMTVPLQAPSDYSFALLAFQKGTTYAALVMSLTALLLIACGVYALRAAVGTKRSPQSRFFCAFAGLGCIACTVKVLLSVGGVLGVLPLTGLPVAWIGYGPVSNLAAFVYLWLAVLAPSTDGAWGRISNAGAKAREVTLGRENTNVGVRAFAVGVLFVLCTVAIVWGGIALFASQDRKSMHIAERRYEAATRIEKAIYRSVDPSPEAACPELNASIKAWDAHLNRGNSEAEKWRIDPGILTEKLSCKQAAESAGDVLREDANRVKPQFNGIRTTVRVQEGDYMTPNAWWGRMGCIEFGEEKCRESMRKTGFIDPYLAPSLTSKAQAAAMVPSGKSIEFQGRSVPKGHDVKVGVDPKIQSLAETVVACYVGALDEAECAHVLPADKGVRSRFFGEGAFRAGAAGITILEVETGAVAAMAGRISGCSLEAFTVDATKEPNGETRSLRKGKHCSQLPDKKHRWLNTLSPALWPVPPGSSLKGFVALAALTGKPDSATENALWRTVLAVSHDQATVHEAAVDHSDRFLDILRQVDMTGGHRDLIQVDETSKKVSDNVRWRYDAGTGAQELKKGNISYAEASKIKEDILAGVNVDRKYGNGKMHEYLKAKQIMDVSIGGGDIRASTLNIAHAYRLLDLAAMGKLEAHAPHAVSIGKTKADEIKLARTEDAKRVVGLLSGVTASNDRGTAAGSCRIVYGSCAGTGVPTLSGKTGTADFTLTEHGAVVKPGQWVPSKMFTALVTINGKRYAMSAMTTRVRNGKTDALELQSNSAAELALTIVREASKTQDGK